MTLLASARERLQSKETPALVYFERILRETLEHFLMLTEALPGRICLYSVKAATFPFLLRLLREQGIAGFDASSPMEALFVARVFTGRVPIFVTAPGITAADFERLERIDPACIHVDSLGSLELGLAHPRPLRLGIRVNPGISYSRQALHAAGGPASRLGLPIAALERALALVRRHGRREIGIHIHTTCEAPNFANHARGVELLGEVLDTGAAAGLTITHLDVGGGLHPPRWDFERDELVSRLEPDACQPLVDALARLRRRHAAILAPDFRVVFEPGDFLVCSAAVMISRITEQRSDGVGTRHLLLDTNINHFPNVLHYGNTPGVLGLARADESGPGVVTLSGNSCLGGDHIAKVRLPTDGAGPADVVFDERGSYEYTQYNFFNGRLRPNVHLYTQAGELVPCKVDEIDDLVGYWREQVPVFPAPYQSFHHFEDIARRELGLHLYHPKLRMISSFEFDPDAFPPPSSLREAMILGFSRGGSIYGRSLGTDDVRRRIAEFESELVGRANFYSPEQVAVTLGATNAIWLTLESLLADGLRRLLIPCPTYYQFASTCARRGIPWTPVHQLQPRRLELADLGSEVAAETLAPTLADMLRAIDAAPDVGALALVTPGLPLGNHYASADIHALANRARADGFVLIVDETLAGLSYAVEDKVDWGWLEPSHPVIRVASISKTFGLPGVRLGYLSVTPAARRRPDTGADVLDKMAELADGAYSAPPAALGPVLEAGLEIQSRWRAGDRGGQVERYAGNLALLRTRAERGAQLLAAAGIPHVRPAAGASLSACLTKLPDCRRDAEPFFRRVLHEHPIFLETGGHFSQDPRWNFTLARLGLARPENEFERDLADLIQTYAAYDSPVDVRDR